MEHTFWFNAIHCNRFRSCGYSQACLPPAVPKVSDLGHSPSSEQVVSIVEKHGISSPACRDLVMALRVVVDAQLCG